MLAAHLSQGAVDYREADYTRPVALLMGAELYGVSEDGLEAADQHVVIPMRGLVQSLTVSVATALLLFEAQRQRTAAGLYDALRLPPQQFHERLFEWGDPREAAVLRRSGRPYPALSVLLDPLTEQQQWQVKKTEHVRKNPPNRPGSVV